MSYDETLAFEIIQAVELLKDRKWIGDALNIPLLSLGNQFLTNAKLQVWICFRDGRVSHIYHVPTKRLHSWYLTKEQFARYRITPVVHGFGLTICAHIPWVDLLASHIVRVWWPKEGEKTI